LFQILMDAPHRSSIDAMTAMRDEPAGNHRSRLSFAGLMHAEPDLAARSEEILREERGRLNDPSPRESSVIDLV